MHVVIGAGLAAVRAIEAMRAAGYGGPITLVGDEVHLPYERPPLSKELLRGQMEPPDTLIQPRTFYQDHGVTLVLGERASTLDPVRRRVRLWSGREIDYQRLLIATGSTPLELPARGTSLENVLSLRRMDDALALRAKLASASRVVVIGAGLVGLEVAAAARGIGKEVVVVEAAPQPLHRLLRGHAAAEAVTRLHADHGVRILSGAKAEVLLGVASVEAVRLGDGTVLPADLVLVGIGVRPATSWLRSAGIALDDGVLVDEYGRTSLPDVFAAGDVARTCFADGRTFRGETYGRAHGQGLAVGRTMAGDPTPHAAVPAASSEQYGVRLQVLGTLDGTERPVTRGDERAFTTFFVRDGRVVGAFVMNRPRDVPFARRLIERGEAADEETLRNEARPATA